MARAAVSQSSGDQLAWDFDDPDAGEAPAPVENEGAARFAPGSIPVGRRAAVHGR